MRHYINPETHKEAMSAPDHSVVYADFADLAAATNRRINMASRVWNRLMVGSAPYFASVEYVATHPPVHNGFGALPTVWELHQRRVIKNQVVTGKGHLWLSPHTVSYNALQFAAQHQALIHYDVAGKGSVQFVHELLGHLASTYALTVPQYELQ